LKITVITVTFNAASTIEQTILSVLDQTYKNVEYIIIDGGSTDGTQKIIERYNSSLGKFISEKDSGLYNALNKGIRMSGGDAIAFLHSDDFYTGKNVLQDYANRFQSENCDAVYADLYYVDRNDTNRIVRKWKSEKYREGDFLKGWMPPHPTFICRKSIYDRFGLYREDFNSAADYELMLRFIQKNKIKISYLPEFVIKMRVGGESNKTVKNRVRANADDRRAWKVNELKPGILTLFLKPLRKIKQFF
jgi:glycosyltransferase involved in cell wall biosynthesis